MYHFVPFLDLSAVHQPLSKQLRLVFNQCLDESQFVLGGSVDKFEQEFADFTKAEYCISVGNGLDALTLALQVIGIGPGSKVLVPSHTFIATWLAVSRLGAIPIPVDICASEYNVNADTIGSVLDDDVDACLVVHMNG